MTILEALQFARTALEDISDAPSLDATRLLEHTLKQNSAWLHAHDEEKLSPSQEIAFRSLVNERSTGRPLGYVVGAWDFYGRTFMVTPDVLIPRPATEELIDQAITTIRSLAAKNQHPVTIADIGTGSGCIAITLALELPSFLLATIYATDISAPALKIAQQNATKHGVSNRIEFLQGDMFTPLQDKKIDLIVSNPPYLPTETLPARRSHGEGGAKVGCSLETIGLTFEPRLALDGGASGTQFTARFAASPVPVIYETTGGTIQQKK